MKVIHPLSIIAVLYGAVLGNLFAQQESPELLNLIQQAQNYRYEHKLNALEKSAWQSEGASAYRVDPLEIGLQYGNNDGPERDTYLEFRQDLGSPWTIGRTKRYANLGVDYTDQSDKRIHQEITYAVTAVYYDFLTSSQTLKLLANLDKTLEKVIVASEGAYQNGALSYAEFLLLRQLHSGILNTYQEQLRINKEITTELRSYCGLEQIQQAEADSLVLLTWNPSLKLSESLFLEQEILLEQIEQRGKVLNGLYHPQIQVGYFYQTLGLNPGHHGVLGGLSIPLVFTGRKNALTQNKLIYQRSEIETEFKRAKLQMELDELTENLTQMSKGLNTFKLDPSACLKGLEQMQQQYAAGEINMFDFIRFSDILIEGAISEMQVMNRYNQLVIRQRFLTQTF